MREVRRKGKRAVERVVPQFGSRLMPNKTEILRYA
jgi:hypothetical protein